MRQKRAALVVIFLNNALMTLGLGLWQAIFNNFAVEELGVRADQIGLIQSIREVPGLLGFLMGLLALFLVEMRIAGLSVVLMGVGIFWTALTRDMIGLVAATVFMSVGFHFFYSSNAAALLLTVGPEEGPKALGRLNSLGALATAVSTLFIFATLDAWGYRTLFQVAGATVVALGIALWPFARQPARGVRERRRTPLRRRYWLYYALQFLSGSRRHIVTTFAVFLLVQDYNVIAQVISLLFLINSLIGTYLHQAFGQIVARLGERRVLAANYAMLALVFLCYTVVPMLDVLRSPTFVIPGLRIGGWVLCPPFPANPGLLILLSVFVIDRISIGFSIAIESYMQKIAVTPQEVTGNVAIGQTINHIAAVIVPVAGGVMWQAIGARYTFIVGVAIVLAALALTPFMRTPQPTPAEASAPSHAA
jgi:predicted MFS family arabinose efflux permease